MSTAKTKARFGKAKYDRITGMTSQGVENELRANISTVEVCVINSTSGANAACSPGTKEKEIHEACFRLSSPPDHYRCPVCAAGSVCCGSSSVRHWMVDCPENGGYKTWRDARRRKYKSAAKDPDVFGDRWYL